MKTAPPSGGLAPACYRPAEAGMVVATHQTNQRVLTSVKMLTELLLADQSTPFAAVNKKLHGDCELGETPTLGRASTGSEASACASEKLERRPPLRRYILW